MRVFAFHLMPYGALDMSYADSYSSVWLKLPNSYFDPRVGHELYNRYLDELELCAELGFDGISVNEHHQNAYGLMPSPVVMASALARRINDTCKVAILGNAFALRDHPLTLAEEHAMIDCITGGRLITGFVRGVGCEYFSMGVNPAYSLERHIEAHDLVIRAWTEEGPFAFEGKHYHFEYVNVWPRPYQQPHPEIWTPSQGSMETIEWSAHPDRKYTYLQAYSPFDSVVRYLDHYRGVAARHGYEAQSSQIGWSVPVYVGETDEQARAEAKPHIEALFNTFLPKISQAMFVPPGYMTADSMKKIFAHKRTIRGGQQMEGMIDSGVILVGSPDTVRRKIEERHAQAGFGNILLMPHFGTLPADLTEKNIRLLAGEVVPHIKTLGDADYRGFEPAAASAAE